MNHGTERSVKASSVTEALIKRLSMNIAIYSDSFCEIEVEALLADDIQISVQKSSGSSDDLLLPAATKLWPRLCFYTCL